MPIGMSQGGTDLKPLFAPTMGLAVVIARPALANYQRISQTS